MSAYVPLVSSSTKSMARRIAAAWNDTAADPNHGICLRRLRREFAQLKAELYDA